MKEEKEEGLAPDDGLLAWLEANPDAPIPFRLAADGEEVAGG